MPEPDEVTSESITENCKERARCDFRIQFAELTRGHSERDMSSSLRIQPEFIKALLEARFEDLPSTISAKGFIKNISRFCGGDSQALLHLYVEGTTDNIVVPSPIKKKNNFDKKWVFIGSALGAVCVVLAVVALVFMNESSPKKSAVSKIKPVQKKIVSTPVVQPDVEAEVTEQLQVVEMAKIEIQKEKMAEKPIGSQKLDILVLSPSSVELCIDAESCLIKKLSIGKHSFKFSQKTVLHTSDINKLKITYNGQKVIPVSRGIQKITFMNPSSIQNSVTKF